MLKFITGNKNKFAEVEAILGAGNVEMLDIDLPEIQEIDAHEIIKAKLEEARKLGHTNCIVEDTSLYLDCLNGLPGPLIKWFMKTIGNEGLFKIAQSFDNSKAQAKTIIGLIPEQGDVQFFEGVVEGEIVEPLAPSGFGWDPIFKPVGFEKSFAEMSQEEKNAVSMRKLAAEKLKNLNV